MTVGRILQRDLRLAFRHWADLAHPLAFFAIVATLFALGSDADAEQLRRSAPGVIWTAALLASLLATETLLRSDYDDGTLEQLALSPVPLHWIMLARVAAHWLVTGVPVIVFAPLLALLYHLSETATWALVAGLALGTPTLSLLGSVGAALTVGLRRGGVLLGLLMLPLLTPVIVFGARAVAMADAGDSPAGPFYLLAALLALAVALAPLAAAAAVRISLD